MNLSMEPLSWLLLERYALGEVSAKERAEVEARLRASAVDRERLDSILHDTVELKPLSALAPVHTLPSKSKQQTGRYPLAALTLAAAAALLALLQKPEAGPVAVQVPESPHNHVKGGELSLSLVSQQGTLNPERFAQGESFKVLVTCPPHFEEELRLFIFQGGARYEPLAPVQLECGNQVPWPGAFSLDGSEPATICVSANPKHANAWTQEALGAEAACTTLVPR